MLAWRTNLVFGAGHVGRDGPLLLLDVLPLPSALQGARRALQGEPSGTLWGMIEHETGR